MIRFESSMTARDLLKLIGEFNVTFRISLQASKYHALWYLRLSLSLFLFKLISPFYFLQKYFSTKNIDKIYSFI